jgi:radical SAM protein with 4Fe4S-binding SPASM domain
MKNYFPENIKKYLSPIYRRFLSVKWILEYKLNIYPTTREIHIEFANFCNLRCKWCSLNHSKEKQILSKKVLETLLKELTYNKKFKSVKNINLWNAGEVLLNTDFILLLKLIKKYKKIGIEKNGYFPKINLLTNGILLTKIMSEKIVSEKILDKIMFSIDGGTKQEYEEIRRGAKWEILVKNISNFLEINKSTMTTEVICMVNPKKQLNQEWMDKDFKEILNKIDIVSLRHPHNWDGSVDLGIKKIGKVKKGCYFLIHQLVLLPNGDITVCCADLNSRGVVGNILKNSLFEIYNSKKRRNMIELNFSGNRKKIPLCQNCDVE